MARLTSNDLTLRDVLKLSTKYWGRDVDDKRPRAWKDIKNARLFFRRGLKYNRKTKSWDQETREVRIMFIMQTEPTSYKKTDKISPHTYPITFIIKNWELGLDSPFKCRVGSMYKPKIQKEKVSEAKTELERNRRRKKNKQYQEYNILHGIQLQFFFNSMWVYKRNNLLYGVDYTNGPPKEKNPKKLIFFSKHEYWLVVKVFPKLFNNPKLNQRFKNDTTD